MSGASVALGVPRAGLGAASRAHVLEAVQGFGDDFGPCLPCSTKLGMACLFVCLVWFSVLIFIRTTFNFFIFFNYNLNFFNFKLAFENAATLIRDSSFSSTVMHSALTVPANCSSRFLTAAAPFVHGGKHCFELLIAKRKRSLSKTSEELVNGQFS